MSAVIWFWIWVAWQLIYQIGGNSTHRAGSFYSPPRWKLPGFPQIVRSLGLLVQLLLRTEAILQHKVNGEQTEGAL